MSTRARIAAGIGALLLVVGVLLLWQQENLRTAWWDALAARGPDAEAMAALQACEGPTWTGWVTVAAAELAMPCGEPLAAAQLGARLDSGLRRRWLASVLEREGLSPRVRWRVTRALELAGAPVGVATVTMATEGQLDDRLALELLSADGGARHPREQRLAALLRAAAGEPADALPVGAVADAGWLSGDHGRAVAALRNSLHVPDDVDPRLHALPASWAEALAPAIACEPSSPGCLATWSEVVARVGQTPEGEPTPLDDGTFEGAVASELGLVAPLLEHEGASDAVRGAVGRLLDDQASLLSLEGHRPWLGVGVPGRAEHLPMALWTGWMGPWTQALWARELARRAKVEGEVRRSDAHLVVTLGAQTRTLCGAAPVPERLEAVLDGELVARALLELHPDGVAAASRLAGWTGPDHGVFGPAGTEAPPADPCREPPAPRSG